MSSDGKLQPLVLQAIHIVNRLLVSSTAHNLKSKVIFVVAICYLESKDIWIYSKMINHFYNTIAR